MPHCLSWDSFVYFSKVNFRTIFSFPPCLPPLNPDRNTGGGRGSKFLLCVIQLSTLMSTYCVHMLICLHNVFNCCISAFRDETCDCFLSERYTAILSPVNMIRVLNEWLSTRIFSYAVDFVYVFVAVKWNAMYIIVMWCIWLYMYLLCTTDSAFVHTCSEVVHCKLYYMWKNWLYVSKKRKKRYTKWAVDVYFSHNRTSYYKYNVI